MFTLLQLPAAPTIRRRWPFFISSGFVSGLVWALLIQLIDTHSPARLAASLTTGVFWLTVPFLGLLILILSFLTRSLFAGNLLVGIPGTVLAFINYYKMAITFLPLTISDFSLIGQVGDIAVLNKESLIPRPTGILALVLAVVWLTAVFFASRWLQLPRKSSLVAGCTVVVIFALVFWFYVNTIIFAPLGVSTEISLPQTAINKETGMILGLWRSLYHAATYTPTPSTEFSEESLEELLQKLEGTTSPPPLLPHPLLLRQIPRLPSLLRLRRNPRRPSLLRLRRNPRRPSPLRPRRNPRRLSPLRPRRNPRLLSPLRPRRNPRLPSLLRPRRNPRRLSPLRLPSLSTPGRI